MRYKTLKIKIPEPRKDGGCSASCPFNDKFCCKKNYSREKKIILNKSEYTYIITPGKRCPWGKPQYFAT